MIEKPKNIKDTLFDYVTDPETWFYWYHNPERLKALYVMDHKGCPDYQEDNYKFTKNVWRFKKSKTVKENIVIEENLADFFDAVLDEVRIKKANAFAEYALYISDNDDLAYFRDRAAKREITADIDYDQQRDHAVHTLYNYLLGWYIFEHSEKLQGAFRSHFKDRLKIDPDKQNKNLLTFYNESEKFAKRLEIKISELNDLIPKPNNLIGLVHEFADVWPIASLLHDIGYILEGILSSASPDVEHVRVINGSKIIHDYFNHWFWKDYGVDFRAAKSIATTLGVMVPDFKRSQSLASLGDHLCDIGSCENIRNDLFREHEDDLYDQNDKSKTYKSIPSISENYGLNREAFSIWKEHYQYHGNKKMEDILYIVEKTYKHNMWIGAGHGKRNLDHGVCSGLITLQALTFFHELFWGFRQAKWSPEPTAVKTADDSFNQKQEKPLENTYNRVSKELFTRIRGEINRVPKRIKVKGGVHSDFWFKKVLWATASAAIHSVIQAKDYEKNCKKHLDEEKPLKIGLDDDPLAFLGVLVDGLQEWDRYKVSLRGEAAFSGIEPLQNTDVKVGCIHSDIIRLKYPKKDGKDWAKELKANNLDKCLENWTDIVEIEGYDR